MNKKLFKREMETILDDIKVRINRIDAEMNSIEETIQNEIRLLADKELKRLSNDQFDSFMNRHKSYLLDLRLKPLKNAKEKLQGIYNEINSNLSFDDKSYSL